MRLDRFSYMLADAQSVHLSPVSARLMLELLITMYLHTHPVSAP